MKNSSRLGAFFRTTSPARPGVYCSAPRKLVLAAAAVLALEFGLLAVPGRVAVAADGPNAPAGAAAGRERVDTALVVAVDVSSSVDARRYRLQMEGIAEALEDKGVLAAMTNGPSGAVLIALVAFADTPVLAVPWTRIASVEDATALAAKVRRLQRPEGNFTCISGMLRFVIDKVVSQIPAPASRVVVDVSGDGAEDCNPRQPVEEARDELVGYGVTVNGLPIKDGQEAGTIEGWYRAHVMGGNGAFVIPANGFEDFGRAIRQKFVVEISAMGWPRRIGMAAPIRGGPGLKDR